MPDRKDPTAGLRPPSVFAGGLHLAALWAIGVIQPLLNLLGSNPDFFVARDNTGAQIILFVVLLTVLPPTLATMLEAGLNLVSRRARRVFHLGLMGLLFATIMMQFFKPLWDGPALPMILVAIALGAGLTWAYATRLFMRSLTNILVIAPPVILIVFLFFSEASELTFAAPEVEAKEVRIGRPAPVVMVIFDEFPAGSLMTPAGKVDGRRFPHFSELAATGTWYRNAVTDASYTAIAVPSILTGKPADRNALPTAAAHPDSIFTLLGGSYRMRAVEPITRLCPEEICEQSGGADRTGLLPALGSLVEDLRYVSAHLLLPASLGAGLPDISQTFEGFGGQQAESVERGRARQWIRDRRDRSHIPLDGEADLQEFLEELDPEAGQTFDFVHIEEPHYPWTRYPDGQAYTESSEDFRRFLGETTWFAGPYLTDRAHQAHLLQAGFADSLLGRVIRALKREGRWDETLVVVTADHGGALTAGLPRREAHPDTMGEIGMVPLFIKAPGQTRGRTVNRPTCTTEILPEIARILAAPVDWKTGSCDRTELGIDNGTGPVIRVPFRRAIAQRDRYVRRLSSLFGGERQAGWSGVFRFGPNRDLIGRRAVSLTDPVAGAETGGDGTAQPDLDPSLGATWRPHLDFNPVLRQRGRLSGVEAGSPLAVGVNGRIAAVGESYREDGATRYSILLPQSVLTPGRNRVSLYLVEATGGSPGDRHLRQLWSSADH